jgi:hypothetical protein
MGQFKLRASRERLGREHYSEKQWSAEAAIRGPRSVFRECKSGENLGKFDDG